MITKAQHDFMDAVRDFKFEVTDIPDDDWNKVVAGEMSGLDVDTEYWTARHKQIMEFITNWIEDGGTIVWEYVQPMYDAMMVCTRYDREIERTTLAKFIEYGYFEKYPVALERWLCDERGKLESSNES